MARLCGARLDAKIGRMDYEPFDASAEHRLREAAADGDGRTWHRLGWQLALAGREREAIDAYRESIAAGCDSWRNLALLLAKQRGRGDEAEAACREAIAAGDTEMWVSLGSLLLMLPGRARDALAACREAIDCGHAERGAEGARMVALVLDAGGELCDARAGYELAVGYGDDGILHSAASCLGYLLGYLGDRAGASVAFEVAARPAARRVFQRMGIVDPDEREQISDFVAARTPRLFAGVVSARWTRRAIRRVRLHYVRRELRRHGHTTVNV